MGEYSNISNINTCQIRMLVIPWHTVNKCSLLKYLFTTANMFHRKLPRLLFFNQRKKERTFYVFGQSQIVDTECISKTFTDNVLH